MKVRHVSVVIGRASVDETIACFRGRDMKVRQKCIVTGRNSKCSHVCVVKERNTEGETFVCCNGVRRMYFVIQRYNDDKEHVFCDGERQWR